MMRNDKYIQQLHKTIDQLKEELAAQKNVSNIYLNTINFICKQLTDKAE